MPRDEGRISEPHRCKVGSACVRRHVCRLAAVPGAEVRTVRAAKGQRIGGAGSGSSCFYVVRSGTVAAQAVMADGRRQLIAFHTPGDLVCPLGVGAAGCWAEALSATVLWEVRLHGPAPREGEAARLWAALFEIAHVELARALTHVVMLGRLDGTERVSVFLADMVRRIGRQSGPRAAWRLSLPMSREDMADYLGLNAETVSRILSRLKKAGIVRFQSPSECEVPDLALLERHAPVRPALAGITPAEPPSERYLGEACV